MQQLLSKGVHPDLFKNERVFAVSDEIANRFDRDRKAFVELAARLGLTEDHLSLITEAKGKLNALRPASYDEKRAASALRALLTCEHPKRERGRPGKVTAQDRLQMHKDADQLRDEGRTTDEIVRMLAQRYELRLSYARRILEDAP
jgi:hypothetical protein